MSVTSDTSLESSEQAEAEPSRFDLIAYSKKHRYRLRNLHDGTLCRRRSHGSRVMQPVAIVVRATAGMQSLGIVATTPWTVTTSASACSSGRREV